VESSFITTSIVIFFLSFLFLITTNARSRTEASQDYLLALIREGTERELKLVKGQVKQSRLSIAVYLARAKPRI
jgi:hypothetical protein